MSKLNRKAAPPAASKLNRRKEAPVVVSKLNRRSSPQEEMPTTHWERIISFGSGVCFVCDHKLHVKNVYIGLHPNGQKLYRCRHHDTFSAEWKKKFNGCKTLMNQGGSNGR
jgi:hypothetical protein